MAKEINKKVIDRKVRAVEQATDVSYGGVGAQGVAVTGANAEDTAPPGAPGTAIEEPKSNAENEDGTDADVSASGIVLATALSGEAKLAVIKATAEMKPGGEYDGPKERDYVISGISNHFKVTKEAVIAELDAALAANVEKADADEIVIMTVPRRFMLRVGTKETLFKPGTVRVARSVAEHPYVKANGCKIV